ncbi:MAG: cytochrome P450 [Halieaceae bacterium]|nr:cytochrome P450 [Halieaceae bacterium]
MKSPEPTPAIPAEFDATRLTLPEVIANPYPYYAKLRDQPPQFGLLDYPPGTIPGLDPPHPAWVFLRYEDVKEIVINHKVFSSRDQMQEESSAPTLMLVNDDPPRHRYLRGLAQQAFMPRRVEEDVAPWAEATVAEMIGRIGGGELEFMDTYAVELPARFITRLMGTPEDDWPRLRNWSSAFMVTSDFTADERSQCNSEIARYYSDAVDERIKAIERGEPVGDDLMSAFIRAEFEGQRLTPEEVKRFCITLVVAGAETTVYFLGNLIAVFLEQPALYRQLRADRTLVRPFIEESLRRDGPPQRLFRVATEDHQVGDALVREGDWVALFYAAANRDPAVFENPDDFILNRPNANRHLTFGHGIHSCMGSRIARMEADKLLNGLLDHFCSIEPGAAEPRRQTGGLLNYGLDSLPVFLRR